MSEDDDRGLQRLKIEGKLPVGFHDLTEDEQRSLVKRLQDQDIEIRGEFLRKAGDSEIAEHDIAVGIDAIERLDHERKIYSKRLKGKTGSGTYDLRIRGGDTKFIVPVLIVIGVIILGIVLILALK